MAKFDASKISSLSEDKKLLKKEKDPRGRKPKAEKEKLVKKVQVNFTENEYAALLALKEARAEKFGVNMPLAQIIRSLCKSKEHF